MKPPMLDISDADRFAIDKSFVSEYSKVPVDFGPLGAITFYRTYSRKKADGTNEDWFECIERVVNGTYTIQKWHCRKNHLPWDDNKAQKSAQRMYRMMYGMKFLPPGRGLQMMGTPYIEQKGGAALNNCFGHDTEVITSLGTKKIGDLAGSTATVLTRGGKWVDAPFTSFGHQKLYEVTISRQGVEKKILATADHRWFAQDRRKQYRDSEFNEFKTVELRPDVHRLQYVFGQGISGITPSPFGIAHGVCFGDGTNNPGERNANSLTLCGEKDKELLKWFNNCPTTESGPNTVVRSCLPNFFKSLPSLSENKSYLLGWLSGYFAADGSMSNSPKITSVSRENIEFVRDVCYILGIGCYSIQQEDKLSNLTGRKFTTYSIAFMRSTLTEDFFLISQHRKNFNELGGSDVDVRYWTVKSVIDTGRVEEVYCATVPGQAAFTLEGNILTGNCGFVSTKDINKDFSEPFCTIMDFSMLGVGMGFDCNGAGTIKIQQPEICGTYVISDDREGWVDALRVTLNAFVGKGKLPEQYDASTVRPEGMPIKGFGGTASGPGPLLRMLGEIQKILKNRIGQYITDADIDDIATNIGVCVVSGNIRRSALIGIGSPDSESFLDLKNPDLPESKEKMMSNRWAANNSIFAKVGMKYDNVGARTAKAGEPGYIWINNARRFARLNGVVVTDDYAEGVNPCAEQLLWNYELCNLVETFISRHADYNELYLTLKYAYLYAKTVTLIKTHNQKTNAVMLRNRRIGLSLSGIQQAFNKIGRREVLNWCDEAYYDIEALDNEYSNWLCIPKSIRRTTVKPSGTVSLLPGVTPGIHHDHSEYYYRLIRVSKTSPLVKAHEQAGFKVEDDVYDPNKKTSVIYFPIKSPHFKKGKAEISMWQQLADAAALQKYWSDNSVSITVTFKPEEAKDIPIALECFEDQLKTVSFLPLEDHGYEQAPYQTITKEEFESAIKSIRNVEYNKSQSVHDTAVRFCEGDICLVEKPKEI